MIAIDTNIIIYLLVSSQPEHGRARAWLESVDEPLATTHTNIAESLRLLSHPKVFDRPMSLNAAVKLISEFVAQYDISILEDQPDWWRAIVELLPFNPTLRGNEVFDARIALCLKHHGTKKLCTLDRDFLKYPFLKVIVI